MGVTQDLLSPSRAPGDRQGPAATGHRLSWFGWLAWASLAVNILIVVTGGVVRLTGSGLGCPTWPRCTTDSLTPHRALGIHGAIEFGNRMVTFLIAAIAVATFLAAWRNRHRLGAGVVRLAGVLLLGVPAQAVLGGITVLTGLNPWTVALHLVVSLVMVSVAVALVLRLARMRAEQQSPQARQGLEAVPSGLRWVVGLLYAVAWAVLYVGTVVTGSGPHAGDAQAARNGLDPRSITQLHTDLVFLLVGLTVAAVLVLRSVGASRTARHAAVALLAVELAQGTVGFVQYFTDLPVALVTLHLLGAALTAATSTWLFLAVLHSPAPAPHPTAA